MILSNDSTTPNTVLDISAGNAVDSTGTANLVLSATTKALAATWASGSGSNGLDTGSPANSTWYHVYIISKADGSAEDVLLSLSATSPTMPSTYTLFRRIGAIYNNGSGHIAAFSQFGDEFRWSVQVTDLNTSSSSTTAALQTLTTPLGVKVRALMMIGTNQTGGVSILVTSPDDADTAPSGSGAGPWSVPPDTSGFVASHNIIRTNTSSQVRLRASAASGFSNICFYTLGWIDDRGRNQ